MYFIAQIAIKLIKISNFALFLNVNRSILWLMIVVMTGWDVMDVLNGYKYSFYYFYYRVILLVKKNLACKISDNYWIVNLNIFALFVEKKFKFFIFIFTNCIFILRKQKRERDQALGKRKSLKIYLFLKKLNKRISS